VLLLYAHVVPVFLSSYLSLSPAWLSQVRFASEALSADLKRVFRRDICVSR
jgi:hypothetical protein